MNAAVSPAVAPVSAPAVKPIVKAGKPAAQKIAKRVFTADKSKTMWIRVLVCEKADITNDELAAILKAGGLASIPMSTISTIANDVRATLKAAAECGLLKKA